MSIRKRPLSGLRARAAVALFDMGWPIRRIALALRSSSGRVQDAIRASLMVVAIVAGLSIVARSQGIAVPNSFVNLTSADADQVNANFSALAAGALNRGGGTMTGTLNTLTILPVTDNLYALGDATHRYTSIYLSGGVTGGAVLLLHEASGTTTAVGAETVDTYAFASALTAKDKVLFVTTVRSGSGITTAPQIKNATDGNVLIGLNNGGDLSALATVMDVGMLAPSGETLIDSYVGFSGSAASPSTAQGAGNIVYKRTARTTAYTGAWSASLVHGGVANPGTSAWRWAIYLVPGQ